MNGSIRTNHGVFWQPLPKPGDEHVAGMPIPKMTPLGKAVVGRLVVGDGQPELLEVVGALGPAGRLARGLHGGQEQGDQHRDDRDDDQELDQRETASVVLTWLIPLLSKIAAKMENPDGRALARWKRKETIGTDLPSTGPSLRSS